MYVMFNMSKFRLKFKITNDYGKNKQLVILNPIIKCLGLH